MRYLGVITNYVDKLGRIKSRELSCYTNLDFEYRPIDGWYNENEYNAQRPKVYTKLTNIESGYEIKTDRGFSSSFQMSYEGANYIEKEL